MSATQLGFYCDCFPYIPFHQILCVDPVPGIPLNEGGKEESGRLAGILDIAGPRYPAIPEDQDVAEQGMAFQKCMSRYWDSLAVFWPPATRSLARSSSLVQLDSQTFSSGFPPTLWRCPLETV